MTPDQLDNYIEQLSHGKNAGQVILNMPGQEQAEAASLAKISSALLGLPKLQAPAPVMRRKYILLPENKKIWLPFLHISNFAAGSTAALMLLAVFAIGGYQAWSSLPGQPLFAVKRTAENVRLKFIMSSEAKAQLQLAYTQNRLDEAQAILTNPQSNKQQEIAALQELASQTKTAADSVQQLALNQPLQNNSRPIVSKLENLTKQQDNLIANTHSNDSDVTVAANSAGDASKTASDQVTQIKKYLAIAESTQDPIAMADLSSDPDTVSISGLVSKTDKDSLTVEKLQFQITDKTEIKDLAGNKVAATDLKTGAKVKVSAKKDHDKLLAQNIITLGSDANNSDGQVKGAATSTPNVNASSTNQTVNQTSTQGSLKTPPDDATSSPISDTKIPAGSFIIENPNAQYSP